MREFWGVNNSTSKKSLLKSIYVCIFENVV